MDIRQIIREELERVMESDYYDRYPDFLDTQFNPQIGAYPVTAIPNYGNVMKEDNLEEDYPISFNMEHFKVLTSFNARIKYCEEHLQRISSGSGRIAYKIDGEKVLKLARNDKGIAQNEVEHDAGKYYDLNDITARVFDNDENYLWIEMELARKMKVSDFKKITGFNWNDYQKAMNNHGVDSVTFTGGKYDIDPKIVEDMWEDEFTYEMLSYMPGYDVPPGDLMKASTYGIVKRDGEDAVVMIDYGFNNSVHADYYT